MIFVEIIFLTTIAVSATVETLHHSYIGGLIWRCWANLFAQTNGLRTFGKGMTCPYCYGVWFGIVYSAILLRIFQQSNLLTYLLLSFILGIASARLAQLLNDILKQFVFIRTPNENRHSSTWTLRRSAMTQEELIEDDGETTVDDRIGDLFKKWTNTKGNND